MSIIDKNSFFVERSIGEMGLFIKSQKGPKESKGSKEIKSSFTIFKELWYLRGRDQA